MTNNFNNLGESLKDIFFNIDEENMSSQDQKAMDIIRKNMFWAMGVGFVPIPIVDLIGVTVVQIDMLKELCRLYGVRYTEIKGKALISSLAGASTARFASSIVKGVPIIGSLFGGISMSALSGASTFAIGRVFAQYLQEGIDLEDIDINKAKVIYEEEFKKGKKMAESMDKDHARMIYEKLEELNKLYQQKLITEEEFNSKKKELLDRL